MMRKTFLSKALAMAAAAVLTVASVPAIAPAVKAYAADEYSYVYAGLTWNEYWENEGVYAAGDDKANETKDTHNEFDKGAFDAVSRATTNHGLHRGSFQCMATVETEEGQKFELAGWSEDGTQMIFTNGDTASYSKGTIEYKGTSFKVKSYEVTGIKYVPVKVKTSDLADFKAKYSVVENGGSLFGGFGENQLKSYNETAEVTEKTNGLKTASKNADGTFSFSARQTGTDSGIKGASLQTASNITVTVNKKNAEKNATGAYGEFLRVDLTGDGYGALGDKMQAVEWNYYGKDSTRTTALATYGTKFAADNWMHKVNGIQLGLTDSDRCQLPANADGTGYWSLTVYALGYADYTVNIEVTEDNLALVKEKVSDTSKLDAAVERAKALKESDYTANSWEKMQVEYDEALEAQNTAEYQAEVDEATQHLNNAIDSLIEEEDDTNYVATYTLFAIIVLAAVVIVVLKVRSSRKNKYRG